MCLPSSGGLTIEGFEIIGMGVEFTNPAALVLLVLIPAAIYLARASLANLSRARGRASLAVRLVILLLVVMALAGIRIRTESRTGLAT